MQSRMPRRATARRLSVGSLVVFACLGLFVLWLADALGGIRQELSLGQSAAQRGRDELVAGDLRAAAASLRDARDRFAGAEDRSGALPLRILGWIPVLGRTSDAVDAIAGSAVTAADATIVLVDAAAEIPGGLAGLAPAGGTVPIERLNVVAEAAREADALVSEAVARLEAAPNSLLIGPVAPARRRAEADLGELRDSIHTSSLLLQGLPRFFGADEARRYLFGAQNPAELRGTGGLIGAYSILTIDAGRFRFSPFVPWSSLGTPRLAEVPPANQDYALNYDTFRRGGRFWSSINVMPDFPSVAQTILNSYDVVTGERLDGVILADPFALAALLEATGPV